MAITQGQLDRLEAAYYAGTTEVRSADGYTVKYASMAELWIAIERGRRELGLNTPNTRSTYATFRKD